MQKGTVYMKIFSTSDIHGNKTIVRNLITTYEASEAELLLICGDIGGKKYSASTISTFGAFQRKDYDHLINELNKCSKPFYCILGNDDWFDVQDKHCLTSGEAADIFNDVKAFDYVAITPFNTNREANENKIAFELEKINIDKNSIILAHCPPYKAQDKIYSGDNVGSKSIRSCIESTQPKIWFCGHIHEDYGVSKIGNTLVVNCSCDHIRNKLKYVIVDIDTLEYSISPA